MEDINKTITKENSFKSSLKVNLEKTNNKKGKSYVIADIHGMYGSYIDAIKSLNIDDHLYILGDVIDRGKEGIKILKDLIYRTENPDQNPKITFLMGNHELQMVNCLVAQTDYNFSKDFYKKIITDNTSFLLDRSIDNLTKADLNLWIYYNSGYDTMMDFLDCSPEEQEKIIKFITDSYIIYSEKINNKKYLFVHASPPNNPILVKKLSKDLDGLKWDYLNLDDYEEILEERNNSSGLLLAKKNGFKTIYGHNPHINGIVNEKYFNAICIDAGCGHKGKLALYCIDDDSVEYIDEKEKQNENSIDEI